MTNRPEQGLVLGRGTMMVLGTVLALLLLLLASGL